MVLHWRRCGRAGGRQTKKRKTDGSLLNIEQASEVSFVGTKREQKRFDEYGANLNQPGRAVKNWFYQWYKKKRDFPLIWLIKYQSVSYLENCIHVNLIKTNQISLIYYRVRYVSAYLINQRFIRSWLRHIYKFDKKSLWKQASNSFFLKLVHLLDKRKIGRHR